MKPFNNDAMVAVLESPTSTEWVFQEPNVPIIVPSAVTFGDVPYVFIRGLNISDADCDSLDILTSTNIGAPSFPSTGSRIPISMPNSSSLPSTPIKAGVSSGPRSIETVPFPLTFVCDMAPGMQKLHGLCGVAIERAFPGAFPHSPFKRGTVYKHMAIYATALEKCLIPPYVDFGATKRGYWTVLKAEVEEIKAAKAGMCINHNIVHITNPIL